MTDDVDAIVRKLTKANYMCGMCFDTGETPRYRGPFSTGPCVACSAIRIRSKLQEQESQQC